MKDNMNDNMKNKTIGSRRSPGLWSLLILLLASGPVLAQRPAPTDRAGWTEKLVQIQESPTLGVDYQALYAFSQAETETVDAVLRDCWGRIPSEKARLYLTQTLVNNNGSGIRVLNGKVEETGQINPYLLDILHLGATDSAPGVRQATFQA